jgi:transposase InsO family protein
VSPLHFRSKLPSHTTNTLITACTLQKPPPNCQSRGWKVNNKRIRRLWRDEGLRDPQRRRKKRLTGIGVAVGAMSPIRPNVIWSMDFQFDTTADGPPHPHLDRVGGYELRLDFIAMAA